MRPLLPLFVLLFFFVYPAGLTLAQDHSLQMPDDSHLAAPDSGPVSSGAWDTSPPPTSHAWSTDFVIGLPTAVRLQRTLIGGDSCALLAEGLVGFELFFPLAGAGLRARFLPCSGHTDALVVSPGMDVYALLNPFRHSGGLFGGGPETIGLVTADTDVSWQHAFGQCEGELGVKVGLGTGFNTSGTFIPVVGIFGGCRF
jgi:hypothetical protein